MVSMVSGEGTKALWLSPTGVQNLERCPRCFWLQYKKGIRQPEGIVSRLANRFDSVIKKYFDAYRPKLPPIISRSLEGALEDPFQEKYFYRHDERYGYLGKLDECLIASDGRRSPVDHKTSSSDPREKETLSAYQDQLNSYAWLLEESGKKTSGVGHLIYFYPDHADDLEKRFPMVVHVSTLATNPDAAKRKFLRAIDVLESAMPSPSADCPFCSWHSKMKDVTAPSSRKARDQESLF